jgi:NAD(P)-dependent dehydrogenase (short-subunit alcohol dehydrogenase family)
MMMSQVVLITGCSTGIGRDLAQHLAGVGYTVVAMARRVETLAALSAALKLQLDVTDPISIQRAVERTLQRYGRIDVLINNAGYATRGAIEELPIDEVERMFDVNAYGVIRMVQAVVPHMRRQKAGRIINISSIAGKFFTPANGAYSATKFALEALSDSLRLELAPFGIQVVLIEPGSIKTQFHKTLEANARGIFSNPASPYHPLYQQYERVTIDMRRDEPGPEVVSRAVLQAMQASSPKPRYLVAFSQSGRLVLLLGDSFWDFVLRRMFKINTATSGSGA